MATTWLQLCSDRSIPHAVLKLQLCIPHAVLKPILAPTSDHICALIGRRFESRPTPTNQVLDESNRRRRRPKTQKTPTKDAGDAARANGFVQFGEDAEVADCDRLSRGISASRRLWSLDSRKSSTVCVENAHVGDCYRSVRRLWSGDFSDHGRRLPRILRLWSATRANPATTVGDSRD